MNIPYQIYHSIMRFANAAFNRIERGRNAEPLSGPVELIVHVTDQCSFACAMCMNARTPITWPPEGRHEPSPAFDDNRFAHLLATWPTAKSVCFAGVGEPLLNDDIERMVYRAHKAGLRTEIITNGTELTANVAWLSSGIVDAVSISVNAWDAESAKNNCGVDADRFMRVEKGIEELQLHRHSTGHPHNLSMSSVLWKGREHDVRQIVDIAARWCISQLAFHELIPSSRPGFGPEAMLTEADRTWMEVLVRQAAERGVYVTFPDLTKAGDPTSSCSSPWRCLYVDAAGGVSGCMRVEAPSIKNGNWADRSVWEGNYFKSLRLAHMGRSPVPDRCRFCIEAHRN